MAADGKHAKFTAEDCDAIRKAYGERGPGWKWTHASLARAWKCGEGTIQRIINRTYKPKGGDA